MNDIENRGDVSKLVETFYAKIKEDQRLGPIFNKRLTSEDIWEQHLVKLTDFWETNLFQVIKFEGNPMKAHQETDKAVDYSINQEDFYQWLMLWNSTIDNLFLGNRANLAKEKARRMSTHLFVNVWKNKPENLLDS